MPPEGFSPEKGYVLVLGPGMFRAMAYVGVLKELSSRGVRVNAIVGTEMGAVVGALFALKGAASMEWIMTKLKKDAFSDVPFITMGEKEAKGDSVSGFLRSNMRGARLEQLKTPVYVTLADAEGKPQPLVSQGILAEVLRDAVATTGLMKPRHKHALRSAVDAAPFPIAEAKALGLGRVVAVDVLTPPAPPEEEGGFEEKTFNVMKRSRELAEGPLKDADTVIHVPVEGISYLSIENRAELAYRGRAAAVKWADEEGLR